MLLPSTESAAILLLIFSFLCLGSWVHLFKASAWRYELFYFDFAAGAFLLSVTAALTLGTYGSELSYVDRMAVAGLRSQALAISAGFAFSIGAMLLLASVSLLGIAFAFPLSFSLAFLVAAAESFRWAGWMPLAGSILCFLASAVLSAMAGQRRAAARVSANKQMARANAGRAPKGIFTAVLGGLLIGVSYPLGTAAFWGDLGLGAYAGNLMFVVGVVLATLLFNIFLMNIGLDGGRVTLPSFLKGKPRQHVLSLLAGIVWSAGMLTALLAQSVPVQTGIGMRWAAHGWVLLAVALGVAVWKELTGAANTVKLPLILSCVAFAAAISISALG